METWDTIVMFQFRHRARDAMHFGAASDAPNGSAYRFEAVCCSGKENNNNIIIIETATAAMCQYCHSLFIISVLV
jgi:hypothetical protein